MEQFPSQGPYPVEWKVISIIYFIISLWFPIIGDGWWPDSDGVHWLHWAVWVQAGIHQIILKINDIEIINKGHNSDHKTVYHWKGWELNFFSLLQWFRQISVIITFVKIVTTIGIFIIMTINNNIIIILLITYKVENSGFFHCCSTFGSGLNTSCDGSLEVFRVWWCWWWWWWWWRWRWWDDEDGDDEW